MKTLAVLATIGGSLICVEANAQERAGSAVLGAVSGAIILGPVGAVAGALVGYTAGPEMRRGLTGEQPPLRARSRRTARPGEGTNRTAAARVAPNPVARSQPSVASQPPVARAPKVTPPAAKTSPSLAATRPLPPVQTFE